MAVLTEPPDLSVQLVDGTIGDLLAGTMRALVVQGGYYELLSDVPAAAKITAPVLLGSRTCAKMVTPDIDGNDVYGAAEWLSGALSWPSCVSGVPGAGDYSVLVYKDSGSPGTSQTVWQWSLADMVYHGPTDLIYDDFASHGDIASPGVALRVGSSPEGPWAFGQFCEDVLRGRFVHASASYRVAYMKAPYAFQATQNVRADVTANVVAVTPVLVKKGWGISPYPGAPASGGPLLLPGAVSVATGTKITGAILYRDAGSASLDPLIYFYPLNYTVPPGGRLTEIAWEDYVDYQRTARAFFL